MEENTKEIIERDSFIFYRSFFEAIKKIENPNDKAMIYDAICELALNNEEIELDGIASIIFPLIKPQIEANYRKFLNGCIKKTKQDTNKDKTKSNQYKSKSKAKPKQSKSKIRTNVNINDNVNVNDNVNDNEYIYVHWFDEFWDMYPRKVNKKKAFDKFVKVCDSQETFDAIMKGLKKYIKCDQWLKDDGQFIPHPTTWLNGEQWNDELEIKINEEKEEVIDYGKVDIRHDDICF